MLAGCYTSDIGPCVEEGGKKGKNTKAVEELVGPKVVTGSHLKVEQMLESNSITASSH